MHALVDVEEDNNCSEVVNDRASAKSILTAILIFHLELLSMQTPGIMRPASINLSCLDDSR